MSSSANKTPKKQSAVYIRDDKAFVAPTKLSKTIINNITSLSNYNSKNPLNQAMIQSVQRMYIKRKITNIKTAVIAINKLDCFIGSWFFGKEIRCYFSYKSSYICS